MTTAKARTLKRFDVIRKMKNKVSAMQVPYFGEGERFVPAVHDGISPKTFKPGAGKAFYWQFKGPKRAVLAGWWLVITGQWKY